MQGSVEVKGKMNTKSEGKAVVGGRGQGAEKGKTVSRLHVGVGGKGEGRGGEGGGARKEGGGGAGGEHLNESAQGVRVATSESEESTSEEKEEEEEGGEEGGEVLLPAGEVREESLGLTVSRSKKNGPVLLSRIDAGRAAARSRMLQQGDELVEIGMQSVARARLDKIAALLAWPRGLDRRVRLVQLSIHRDGACYT